MATAVCGTSYQQAADVAQCAGQDYVKSCAAEFRRRLHSLPMRQNIKYEIALMAYKARSADTPTCFTVILHSVTGITLF